MPVCGDRVLLGTEVCDDGNVDDGDYCSSDCLKETGYCGDGVRQTNEGCDDGALNTVDGCGADCLLEYGGSCVHCEECDPQSTCQLSGISHDVYVWGQSDLKQQFWEWWVEALGGAGTFVDCGSSSWTVHDSAPSGCTIPHGELEACVVEAGNKCNALRDCRYCE